jgi:hypothetical protein
MSEKETWAIVELMGHVRLAGRLSEEEKFGSKIGRLDIPTAEKCTCPNAARESVESPTVPCEKCCGSGIVRTFITQYFGGGSVYRISIVSEDVARHVSRSTTPAPVSPWDFPKAMLPAPATPDRTMSCGHTPENCDCDPPDDEEEYDDSFTLT